MKSARRAWHAVAVACGLAVVMALAPIAGASTLVVVPGQLARLLSGATDLGASVTGSPARALIALKPRDPAGLARFIAAVSNPRSPQYGHYLTPAQYLARFAPSQATVDAVTAYARAAGFQIAEVPADRQYVYVTGTVVSAERAFAVSLHRFLVRGSSVQAPTGPVQLPAAIAGQVSEVQGLNTADRVRLSASPPAVYVNSPPCTAYFGQQEAVGAPPVYGAKSAPPVVPCGYTPQQLRAAYGFAPAIAAGIDGRGQTVAVIDAYSSPTLAPDVQTWSGRHGLPAPNLLIDDTQAQRNALQIPPLLAPLPNVFNALPLVITGIGSFDPQGWSQEETLDVEAVHAFAPGARIIYQGADSDNGLDLTRAQNQVVQNNQAQIVSNSYGGNMDVTQPASDSIWQQAAAQGIGVYFSSGDNGDETGGTGAAAQRQTDAGANSPYVTAVGGTTIGISPGDKYGFETYWGVYNDPLAGGQYAQAPPGKFLYGGGGGTSEVYAEPSWQKPVVANKFASYWKGNAAAVDGASIPGRVVPDVAIDGDPQTGLMIGLTQDFDAYKNGQLGALPSDKNLAYSEYRIGGTSLSSPLFAGVMALADQAAGKRLGFANPLLYASITRNAFHDIKAPPAAVAVLRTDYVNQTNAAGGTKQELRTTGQTVSLTSGPGFDDSTGLGTPRGLSFLAALAPDNTVIAKLVKKSAKPVKKSKRSRIRRPKKRRVPARTH